MPSYKATYKGLHFNINTADNVMYVQNDETGKINYTKLFGDGDYKELNGFEHHQNDLPIGIAGDYAYVDDDFIKRRDAEKADSIIDKFSHVRHNAKMNWKTISPTVLNNVLNNAFGSNALNNAFGNTFMIDVGFGNMVSGVWM